MTKEEFNTKYKDKFRINDYCDLEQLYKCKCEHCQECKYSYPEEWLTFIETTDELEMLCDYTKVIEDIINIKNKEEI